VNPDDGFFDAASMRFSPQPPADRVVLCLRWWSTINVRASVLARRTLHVIDSLPTWPVQADTNKRRAHMHEAFHAATEAYDASTSLALIGPTSSGKTLGTIHAIFRLIERGITEQRRWPVPTFTKATQLAIARKQTRLGEGEAELVTKALAADLFILDDLGQEAPNGDTAIWDVVDGRYDKGLPTLITSGLTVDELTTRYGEAFVRRLVQAGGKGRIVSAFAKQTMRAVR
jgi:DNA replication protein DnaC